MPKQKQSDIEAVKVVGQIIVAQKNDDGQVIAEQAIGEAVIYAPHFPDALKEQIEESRAQIEEMFGVSRNGTVVPD